MPMVRFEKLNLKDTLSAKRFGKFDVIFCRNVLIYFDDTMRSTCAKLFHEQLEDHGTLFIGHSETLRNIDVPFTPMPIPQAFAYRKNSRGVAESGSQGSGIRGQGSGIGEGSEIRQKSVACSPNPAPRIPALIPNP